MLLKRYFLFYTFSFVVPFGARAAAEPEETEKAEYTGKQATAGQFPFAVRLYSRLRDNTVRYCTATIITHSKLLTAGHCCSTKGFRTVVAGDPDHTDFVLHYDKTKYHIYKVKKVVVHPKFERSHTKLVFDLCMLILEEPLSLKDGHRPIDISYEKLEGKKNCTALGWGSNFGYQIQHKLHYKEAIAYRCNLRFGNSSKYWFVCLEPHSVCPGDSGGPLVCDGKLYGIASFFIGDGDGGGEGEGKGEGDGEEYYAKCEEGMVDYYSDVSEEREFIEKNSCVRISPPPPLIYSTLGVVLRGLLVEYNM